MPKLARLLAPPLVAAVVLAPGAGVAQAKKHAAHRRGGTVRVAWPRKHGAKAPRRPLARWLARQVGPVKVTTRQRVRALAHAAASGSTPSGVTLASDSPGSLLLVRSFDIPKADPAYARLANYSWTYDNALAVFGFLSAGSKTIAEQLLDQLMALQKTDGSIAYAYDSSTGAGATQVRSGAMAWVGLAATAYKSLYGSTRYDPLIAGVARYLLGLRTSDGLVKGGPDVSWVSTQHNLLTVGFLRDLVDVLKARKQTLGTGLSSTDLDAAQSTMGNAIIAKLLVQDGTQAHFIEGLNDAKVPLDVQALGAMYLKLRGDGRASQVASYIQSRMYLSDRAVSGTKSTISGYLPFLGSTAPQVIWSEGTLETALALGRLGISDANAVRAGFQILATTSAGTAGPVGADRDVTDSEWGEYHTWPTSAVGSWLLIAGSSQQLLFTN